MFNTIKEIFLDLLFIYKNFFHWVLSKILISITTYILAIILAIPFLIIAGLIIYISPLSLSNFFM
jgi:hypothetical protein